MTENEYKYIIDKIKSIDNNIDIINNKIDIVIEFINIYSSERERLLRERESGANFDKTASGCGYVDNYVDKPEKKLDKNAHKIAYNDLGGIDTPDSQQNGVIRHFRPVKNEIKELYLGSGNVVIGDIELINGKAYICEDQIEQWKNIYKAIDVMLEVKKSVEWLKANPKRNKTITGFYRYVNGWLARANDRMHYYENKSLSNKLNNSLQDKDDLWDKQFSNKEDL